MRFSIITPSFRNSEWLKLCIESVADQSVPFEHIVQDSCSDDGTQDWLTTDSRVHAFIEKDRGMYDAVNRGLRRATGDIFAYINCDEQYLPGGLAAVRSFFQARPEVEIVFANTIVVNSAGNYVCERRASIPNSYHSWVSGNLAIFTAATFFRCSLIHQRRLFFDADRRDVSDAVWIIKLIEEGVPMAVLSQFTSVFTETAANMNLKPNARREQTELVMQAPALARLARPFVVAHYRLRRLLAGHYRPRPPFDYGIYTVKSPKKRVTFHVDKPTFRFQRLTPSRS